MDIQLMNLEQAYEMGLELLDSAKRPLFCRCRSVSCQLPEEVEIKGSHVYQGA